jgi:hypothetical protein
MLTIQRAKGIMQKKKRSAFIRGEIRIWSVDLNDFLMRFSAFPDIGIK